MEWTPLIASTQAASAQVGTNSQRNRNLVVSSFDWLRRACICRVLNPGFRSRYTANDRAPKKVRDVIVEVEAAAAAAVKQKLKLALLVGKLAL